MIRECLENITNGVEIRKNLIALKAQCKEYAGKHALLYALNNKLDVLYDLLKEEDPKIRKNVALILGQLGVQESLSKLYEAYEKEKTLFVKSSYLAAMKELDYRPCLEQLRQRENELQNMEFPEESSKHLQEERKLLQEMLLTMEGQKKHKFTGWNKPSRVILLTNRNFQGVTADQIKSHRPKVFNAGVQARTDDLKEIYKVRTFSELLFVLEGQSSLKVPKDASLDEMAKKMAKDIADGSLLEFLQERHSGKAPFYFRIECKNKMDRKQKSNFTKKLAAYLQTNTKDALRNSTSHYEVELRLVENKSGDFNFLIKLYTYEDPRFSYRREALATSIQPVNAALAMELVRPYLKEGAQVIDPFCGVGTMLIERGKLLPTGDVYGVDIYGQGIEGARTNTELAGQKINYINRDFFDFSHGYLFDEVISNMPRVMGQKTNKEITDLYIKFWLKIQIHLGKDATIVLYCYDRDILRKTLPKTFSIKEEFEISKKEGSYVYVLKHV